MLHPLLQASGDDVEDINLTDEGEEGGKDEPQTDSHDIEGGEC